MFAMDAYDRYVKLQERADIIWRAGEMGDVSPMEVLTAQAEANRAYEDWEYLAGIKSFEDY